jgi:uncharacterized BrkB/YihY/UPF0761 family membrane protein
MSEEQRSSLLVRILSVAFFLILTLGACTWFFISTTGLIYQFRIESQVVGFDKGSMYMLGCGLGLLLLTIGGVMQGIFALELTPKKQSLFSRGIVISLILMVLFPQLTHYVVDKYAQKQSYSICHDASYRWLLYSKLYYTKSRIVCNELVKEKEITKSSSGH